LPQQRIQNEDLANCREVRGPLIPLALDMNHWTLQDPKAGRFMVVREGGRIDNVPIDKNKDAPCHVEILYHLNY
jgi:hypothetical protein